MENFYRINFVGRPFELNKLVYDDNLLVNEEQAKTIANAFRKFNGWQYVGLISSFFSTIIVYKFAKNKLGLALIILPFTCCYVYSHFCYWDDLRETLKEIRNENRNVKQGEIFKKKIESQEIRNKFLENFGVIDCLKEIKFV